MRQKTEKTQNVNLFRPNYPLTPAMYVYTLYNLHRSVNSSNI